ncbi:MAG TPA: DNA-binding response regulator [Myxococcales bacterium]|nr:DNA-binding response regulator [Deltaproteobacteria bacterium]HAA55675.1 DNA-binding response regulator [Myxococcales bacterium]
MSATILLVEDEEDLINTLEYNFQKEGYQIQSTMKGSEAIQLASEPPFPDLMVLDLMLPDISGIEVCRQIRSSESTKHIPILMLTAKGEEIDRIVGFEVGADDYMVKPFSIRELILRVRALLRRSQHTQSNETTPELMRFGRLRLDPTGHQAWIDDKELKLTVLEFRLLHTFLSRKGRVQTREVLLSDVWGIESHVTTRTVDTHVKRLREKLGDMGNSIETLRGVGYKLKAHADEKA